MYMFSTCTFCDRPCFCVRSLVLAPHDAVEWGEATDGVVLEDEDGTAVCSGDSGVPYNYALAGFCFSKGRHSWDVSVVNDDESRSVRNRLDTRRLERALVRRLFLNVAR